MDGYHLSDNLYGKAEQVYGSPLPRDVQKRLPYSRKQFPKRDSHEIIVAENFQEKARAGDFCFVEDKDAAAFIDRAERIVIYRWNRKYPADCFFKMPSDGWKLIESVEFAGFCTKRLQGRYMLNEDKIVHAVDVNLKRIGGIYERI